MKKTPPRKEKNDRNSLYSEPKEINKSDNTKNTEETQEILRLSVELGTNELDYIHIFKNSQPEQLAYYFCTRNKLDYECLQLLINEIKSAMDNEKEASSSNIKEASMSDLLTPEISPKPIDSPISTACNHNHNKLNHPLSNKHSTTKKINHMQTAQLLTSFDAKPSLFATETYIQTQAKPVTTNCTPKKKSKPQLKLNQSSAARKTMTLQTQDLKSSSSQSKITNKQTRVFSPIVTSVTSNRFPLNYGERLYHKGLKIQERTQEKLAAKQKQMRLSNISTYKPFTNMISYNALSKRLINKKNYNNEQIILGYKDYVNSKIDKLKEKHKPKENYSFSPKLNQRSLLIESTKDKEHKEHHNEQRYESLYENYKSQRLNLEKLKTKIYNKDKMFKPSVNQYDCAYTSMSFNDRQGYFTSKSKEKQNQTKKQIELNQDKKTGQTYFSPEINDCYQRLDNRNIFDDLYYDHNRHQQKKKALEAFYAADFRTSQSNVSANQQSKDIFEGLKERAFKAIFNALDKDKDGLINQRNIAINALPKNIEAILEPIFYGLKKEDRTLSEEEFAANCFQLFDLIEYTEKKEIIKFIYKKKINNPNNFSFHPTTNAPASCKRIKNNNNNSLTLSWKNFKSNANDENSNNSNSNKKLITELLPSNKPEEMKFEIEEEGTQEERNDNDDDAIEIVSNEAQ